MSSPASSDRELVERALAHDRYATARLISLFEDRRRAAVDRRAAALAAADELTTRPPAVVIGLTGTPGSGKSTLLSRIVPALLAAKKDFTAAVLAIDPSSTISGGALLGDRTRMRLDHDEPRLFFRSQASDTQLGGLSPTSHRVCQLLIRLFDCVFVETVGIGQSEDDVRSVADRVYLVIQPLGGDEVQFLKAGIMEVPDAFVLNKCDDPSTELSYHKLRSILPLARPNDGDRVPIFKTSAKTGEGIDALVQSMIEAIAEERWRDRSPKDVLFFERWVLGEWGRAGSRFLATLEGGARGCIQTAGGVERAQLEFERKFRDELGGASTPARKAGE